MPIRPCLRRWRPALRDALSPCARLLAPLLTAAALACAPAAAEPNANAAEAELRACLASTDDAGRPAEDCLNAAMSPCVNAPGGETTLGAIACASAALTAWDKLLNEYYLEARAGLDAEGQLALRDAQRAWISFRDKSCDVWLAVFRGGSLGRQIRADCLRETTARRALDLRGIARTY